MSVTQHELLLWWLMLVCDVPSGAGASMRAMLTAVAGVHAPGCCCIHRSRPNPEHLTTYMFCSELSKMLQTAMLGSQETSTTAAGMSVNLMHCTTDVARSMTQMCTL